MTPDARIQALAVEAKRSAQKHGYHAPSHKFAAYVRAQFAVAVSQHPEIATMKPQYLKAVGLTV